MNQSNEQEGVESWRFTILKFISEIKDDESPNPAKKSVEEIPDKTDSSLVRVGGIEILPQISKSKNKDSN